MSEETKDNPDEATLEESSSENAPMTDSELDNLRQELAAKELEAKTNYDRFLRQVAELDNVKKRSAREREDTPNGGAELGHSGRLYDGGRLTAGGYSIRRKGGRASRRRPPMHRSGRFAAYTAPPAVRAVQGPQGTYPCPS